MLGRIEHGELGSNLLRQEGTGYMGTSDEPVPILLGDIYREEDIPFQGKGDSLRSIVTFSGNAARHPPDLPSLQCVKMQ